eukprot:COSAG04_NODE_8766_length_933_cov_0.998801_1_plen_81_part_10
MDVWCRLTGATKLPALLKAVGRADLIKDAPSEAELFRGGGGGGELSRVVTEAFASRTLEEWKESGDLDQTFFSYAAALVWR